MQPYRRLRLTPIHAFLPTVTMNGPRSPPLGEITSPAEIRGNRNVPSSIPCLCASNQAFGDGLLGKLPKNQELTERKPKQRSPDGGRRQPLPQSCILNWLGGARRLECRVGLPRYAHWPAGRAGRAPDEWCAWHILIPAPVSSAAEPASPAGMQPAARSAGRV